MFRVITNRFVALLCIINFVIVSAPFAAAQGGDRITVQVNRPGAKIAPTMHGLFFEDINFAADGVPEFTPPPPQVVGPPGWGRGRGDSRNHIATPAGHWAAGVGQRVG